MEHTQHDKQKHRRGPLLGFGIILLFIIVVVVNLHSIEDQLNAWKFLPEQEKLTELYFNNPNKLPEQYSPGQSEMVSFTIHNLEDKSMNYDYQLIESSQNASQSVVLVRGSFDLKQNQYKSLSLNVLLVNVGSKAKITIKLANVNESIDYLVARNGL